MVDFEEHFVEGQSTIVVAFAGGPQNVYQWGRTLRRLGVSHVLMRDTTQRYHSHGVEGLGDREAVVAYLRWLKRLRHDTMLVTCGVSSGGYAALLYGQLVPADEVLAISPLTGRELDDWPEEMHARIHDPNQELDDLRKYFPHGPVPHVRAFISDLGESCRADLQMCTRIGIDEHDVTLIRGYEHGDLARGMRDLGLLDQLLLG